MLRLKYLSVLRRDGAARCQYLAQDLKNLRPGRWLEIEPRDGCVGQQHRVLGSVRERRAYHPLPTLVHFRRQGERLGYRTGRVEQLQQDPAFLVPRDVESQRHIRQIPVSSSAVLYEDRRVLIF